MIVFANSRRLAEQLTARLNELVAESAEAIGESGIAIGAPPVVARAHHVDVPRTGNTVNRRQP
ncbi:hypothetical protein ACH40F_56950 [Streptomyces sp. NPDC020794]|uniref:hypothetical protein n=1 Tax=unclassified Streptomyces TaxID=2593676 RepID=UPI0036EEA801